MKTSTIMDDDQLTIPALARRRNANFRAAVKRAEKLLNEKKGDGTVKLVPPPDRPHKKIADLFKSKCFSPDSFSGAEQNAIRRWRDGNVMENDLPLIDAMHHLHLKPTVMGESIPEVCPKAD